MAVPAALWSVGRPLVWIGAGLATLAGVVVVAAALVALEVIVEGDGEPPGAVAPPPTTSTPAAAPPAPGACATPTDPTCIRTVYIGAPRDYVQVADIPSAMLLSGGPGGTYRVDAGLEVTVVTAARLPGGWTRFYLDQSPLGDLPVSASQLIKPIGTTYTFRVSEDDAAPTLITFELKAARPFVRPRPDGKPEIGATVVETDFAVNDCSSGVAVTNPQTNTGLVADCESLLGLRGTIRGSGKLNWTAGKAMSDWMGVTVSGTPQRVTGLNLANLGLDGELSGLLGELTGLTTLNLSGNALTGMIPSKLELLSLTSVTLDETFEGCAPPGLNTASGLTACGAPTDTWSLERGDPLPAGTYEFDPGTDEPTVVFDVLGDSGLLYQGARLIYPQPGRWKNSTSMMIFANAEQTAWISVDLGWVRPGSLSFTDGFTSTGTESGHSRADFEAIYKQISESIWERVD